MMPWNKSSGRKEDLLGREFGHLKVTAKAPSQMDSCGTMRAKWIVKCRCGSEFETAARYLKRGTRISCDEKLCKMRATRELFPST